MLRAAKSTICNTKRPGKPRKPTKVDDRRITSLVKKNPFTTSSHVNVKGGWRIIVKVYNQEMSS